jgi:hypothetical protein
MLGTFLRCATKAPLAAVVAYIGDSQDTANRTTYSFSNVSIGTASSDRIVVLGISGVSVSEGSVSSVTIGGTEATIHTQVSNGQTCIASLVVPSGTTATIGVTYSAGRGNCTVYVWTIKQASSSSPLSVDSQTNSTSSTSITLDGQVGAVGCAVAFVLTTGSSTFSWSGLTVSADQAAETRRTSGASGNLANSSNTVTATNSLSSSTVLLSGASWR